MNDVVYEEVFERTGYNTKGEAIHEIDAIIEAHPQEYGWEYGKPEIFQDFDGKYGVRVPLKKYSVNNNTFGRLR